MTEEAPATSTPPVSDPTQSVQDQSQQAPTHYALIDHRVLLLCSISVGLGLTAALVAQVLIALINLITNVAYFGRISLEFQPPADAIPQLGVWSVPIPIIGALIVGMMARYGSKAIRGHGIPEAMEQVLTNESRIPARVTFLKPVSSAISIGTGGPFGAEGPIIATGAALGSVLGQIIRTSAMERKTLLAVGAAAGMAATFGSPVAAVLLSIELLLFEFRPRSIIPVALAAATATGVRMAFEGVEPVFAMTDLTQPSGSALATYILLGGLMGFVSVAVTKVVYAIEDGFERLPFHWMWWPAVGAIAVGVVGLIVPDTLGVGYYNISNILSNRLALGTIVLLCTFKFISWAISLGSGTSGGTLAPLFTIGGGLGAVLGILIAGVAPGLGIDPRIAALVGMASIFAGASRAMLASAVFAFETTLQPLGLLPLLGGCAAAYLASSLLMRNSIMTEKIARRGIRTPEEYLADSLDQVLVRDIASGQVVCVVADKTVEVVREWLSAKGPGTAHQGFPVTNEQGSLVGVITSREIWDSDLATECKIIDVLRQPVRYVYDDCTVRQAADHMVNHNIGRLPVVSRSAPHRLVGIVTRSDILSVFQRQVRENQVQEATIPLTSLWRLRRPTSSAT